MPLDYCVYVLFNQMNLQFYIGNTTNLKARLKDHNKGGTKSTASRRPLELVLCEFYKSVIDARRREIL